MDSPKSEPGLVVLALTVIAALSVAMAGEACRKVAVEAKMKQAINRLKADTTLRYQDQGYTSTTSLGTVSPIPRASELSGESLLSV